MACMFSIHDSGDFRSWSAWMNSVENVCILMKIYEDPERKSGRFLDRGNPLHLVSSETASVWVGIGIRSCYSISRQQYHHATGHRPNHYFVLVTPPPSPVKHSPATHYLWVGDDYWHKIGIMMSNKIAYEGSVSQ